MYTIQPKRNNHVVVFKRPDCRKACSASPNSTSHATKKALLCCKRYHSARRKRLFRKTEDKVSRATGSLTAYQSAGYGKTVKSVIFRENSLRADRVSEYGSFRDIVLTSNTQDMLIYVYKDCPMISHPSVFPTLPHVPQSDPRALAPKRDTNIFRAVSWRELPPYACAETPK